jgi:hypothetical protein
VILTSLAFLSNSLEKKINQFIVNQKRYLTYKPKTIDEKNEMTLGIGRIDSNNTLYYKNVILYRKNNLPDNRKPNNYISYTFIKYKDSTQCKKALLSWINCFGIDCTKMKLNEDNLGLKTTPIFVIVNSDEILIAHTQCEFYYNSVNPQNKSELWKTVIFDFKNHFSKNNSVFIDVGCGGPLKWTTK